jgi:Zn-dependent peptidase ImmA (M78 family)
MARSTEALVEPAILEWARSTAGLSVEEAAASLQSKPEKVLAWETGDESPSMAQLRKMAAVYKRMLSDFYLPAVPDEEALPHDFRRLPGEVAHNYSRALRVQLRLAHQRRVLALDLASDLDEEVPALQGRLRINADTESTGAELRRLLDVPLNMQRTWRDPRASYNGWRTAIERAGILVFQAAGIPTKEMLGFSLPERPLPVIGVNRKLRPNGRIFTLLHECVHVFLEQSSICDIDDTVLRPPEEQRVEVFCNAVAGAALVPLDSLLTEPLVRVHPARPRDWRPEELSTLARAFGVSEEVILRRLLTAGRASRAFYGAKRAVWGSLMDDVATADPEAEFKRNMPQEVVSDLGKPFTRLVVDSYLNSFTSLSDVSKYLGLRAGQVSKVQELLMRS